MQGRQALGEAGYGCLDARGFHLESADFHEYMQLGWAFQDGCRVPEVTYSI
ncbi:hypothetical protein [Streptomyces sp. SID12488]|uniref:hypothetical protein n=1 Tax=Streptomyces sp. SID12488 TaxID=2706040 RepID=UPI0013DB082B|nr:hypothetical protein [Streptomyces sp. SID12488]NEA67037.1 hypothetical protein [Streptomyces sp. SID12488]